MSKVDIDQGGKEDHQERGECLGGLQRMDVKKEIWKL